MAESLWLYHYTDRCSANGIKATTKIYASTDTELDATWGVGTYFTDMKPSRYSLREIAYNNWQQHRLTTSIREQLEYCIKVKFSRWEVKKCHGDGRRIFLYRGNVKLRKRDYQIIKVLDDESETSDSDIDNSDSETSDSEEDSSESETSDSYKDSSESETSDSENICSESEAEVSDSDSISD